MAYDRQIRIPTLDEIDRPSPSSSVDANEHEIERANLVMTMTPCNIDSLCNFHRACKMIKEQPDPDGGRHHDAFLTMNPGLTTVGEALGADFANSSASADTDVTSMSSSLKVLSEFVQTGFYRLSFDVKPNKPSAGWCLGSGRPDFENRGVDFLLDKESGIRGVPLVFKFSKNGQLSVWVRNGIVTLDGSPLPKRQMVPLPRVRHFLGIHHLTYRLDYVVPEELERLHYQQKCKYLEKHQMLPPPPMLLSATPRENDEFLGKWKLHGVIGVGGSSVFDAASHTEREEIVAMKKLVRKSPWAARRVDEEIGLYKEIKKSLADSEYRHHVMQIEEVLYSTQPDYVASQPDRVFLLYSPLGRTTLSAAILDRDDSSCPPVTQDMKRYFFAQILMGVSALHKAGWIHRDVKPDNVTIVSFDPPAAVLIDLGQAIRIASTPRPMPRTCGTVGYLAPELENPQYTDEGFYTEAVDIWSLGTIGLDLFVRGNPWGAIRRNPFLEPENREDIQMCQRMLPPRHSRTDSLDGLINHMLEFHAADRITSMDALAHPALETFVAKETASPGDKRKRNV